MDNNSEGSSARNAKTIPGPNSQQVQNHNTDEDKDLWKGASYYDNLRLDSVMPSIHLPELEPNITVPCRLGIFGPSQCGKSTFIKQLLKYRNMCFSGSFDQVYYCCLLYTSPSPRDGLLSRMPSSA